MKKKKSSIARGKISLCPGTGTWCMLGGEKYLGNKKKNTSWLNKRSGKTIVIEIC